MGLIHAIYALIATQQGSVPTNLVLYDDGTELLYDDGTNVIYLPV